MMTLPRAGAAMRARSRRLVLCASRRSICPWVRRKLNPSAIAANTKLATRRHQLTAVGRTMLSMHKTR